jgi:hypothetical protein
MTRVNKNVEIKEVLKRLKTGRYTNLTKKHHILILSLYYPYYINNDGLFFC